MDNVYSHRSTQEYKKQPIVSRYFDCRMKGRPPGTKKSDDPTKKKRQRAQRQLNQCDVKIKLTEYLEGSTLQYLVDEAARSRRKSGGRGADDGSASPSNSSSVGAVNAAIARGSGAHVPGLGLDGRRFWTVERVNGGGAKGGAATTPAGDERLGAGAPGAVDAGHKHDLAKSDEIKKNSVQRHEQDKERVMRKQMVRLRASLSGLRYSACFPDCFLTNPRLQKHFSRRPTGEALDTYKKHQKARDLKLYGACYWSVFFSNSLVRRTQPNVGCTAPFHSGSGSHLRSRKSSINTSRRILTNGQLSYWNAIPRAKPRDCETDNLL